MLVETAISVALYTVFGVLLAHGVSTIATWLRRR
jgi:hypothetical protein